MKTISKLAALVLICIFSFVTQLQAQMDHMPAGHIMVMPDDIVWADGPASLPPGVKSSVIEGDPKAAGLFTMRLSLPAKYRIMPHSHPAMEHVTVIKGSFYMGVGEKFNEVAGRMIPKGGFAVMNTGTKHFAFTKKKAIIQLHGMGPWAINYVNAADDPRNKKQ